MEELVATTRFATFYRGATVLVTGHTGFKGSWLCMMLRSLGANVVGFSLPPEEESLFRQASLQDQVTSVLGDVRDKEAVAATVAGHEPKIVFHLAAQSLVRRSYREPVATFATNVMGTVHVLEAIRSCGAVRAAVVVTSDKCYENRDWVWGYREDDRMGGVDPYSSSKGCSELVVAAYRRSFFLTTSQQIATARAGNVIGGGDWAEDRLIPDIVRAVRSAQPVIIRHPNAVRPWQHVLDVVYGYLLLARSLTLADSASAWNFGPPPEDCLKVGEIAPRFFELLGTGRMAFSEQAPPQHESHALRLDSSKARIVLGWKPALDVQRSLELTAAWYKRFLADPASARAMTAAQVDEYLRSR